MGIEDRREWVDDSLEYEFVQKEELDRDTRLPVPLPAENFQGTWDGTLNEGKKAYKEVAAASSTYYTTLANSSLSKAAFSLGGALAGTANRTALSAADYAVKATVSDRSRLPPVLGNWLKGKDKFDEAKKRKKEAEKARLLRKYKQELIDAGEVVDNPSRPGSRTSSFGDGRRESIGSISKAFQTPGPVRRQLKAPLLGEDDAGRVVTSPEALHATLQDTKHSSSPPRSTSGSTIPKSSSLTRSPAMLFPSDEVETPYLASSVRSSTRRSVASRSRGDGFKEETLSVPEEKSEQKKTVEDEDSDDESAVGLGAMLEEAGIDM
ncbi:hypothetical protein BDV96DRAFT_177560 [Lophiotrema nucula]|uniref:Uncharacterized protein n=1 Tax=Lophiotrema nucula TaxID=690887 RepID=A0A6A5Z056_9PLEO|nr:hypothetical protein BDV96DRAFT_177560 [Lophiotrema nucula]